MPDMWKPIIQSRLDTDFYKFLMGQFVYHRYPHVPVTYGLKNRTKNIAIADFVEEKDLRRELDWLQTLKLRDEEINYLYDLQFENGTHIFADDYLEFLVGQKRLPPYQLFKENGEYVLTFPGEWSDAIYWESPALAIVTELVYREMMNRLSKEEQVKTFQEGMRRLFEKCELLPPYYPDARFMEFGTRRRSSRDWQDYVIAAIKILIPQRLMGTSNVWFAMRHGLKPLGTFAHELYMAFACIYHSSDDDIRRSHGRVLDEWEEEYSPHLLIALTDAFGSSFFFSDFKDRAPRWDGLRQDSGNPDEFAKVAIEFYKSCGIDPKKKITLFSDGLTAGEIIRLHLAWREKLTDRYGWGTSLTNDLGFPPLSIVIKLIECCGHPAIKLSDNLAKATGHADEIERYKKIFTYTGTLYEPCTY